MPSIGTVSADLILNSASFISNFQKAADATARNTRQISQQMSGLQASIANASSAFKGFVAGFATVSTVQGLVRLGQSAIDVGDAIDTAAKRIGASAEDLQKFRFAAEQAGVSTGELDSALKVFGANFAKGQLATSQATLTGAFNEFIERIAEAPTFLEKARISSEAFGRQWQIGIALASEGAGKFAENAKGAFFISDELVRKANALDSAFAKVRNSISAGFATGFLEEFGKGLGESKKALDDLGAAAQGLGNELARMGNDVIEMGSSIREGWTNVTEIIEAVVADIEWAITRIKSFAAEVKGIWDSISSPPAGLSPLSMDFFGGGGPKGAGTGALGDFGSSLLNARPFAFPQKQAFPTPDKSWQDWAQFQSGLAKSTAELDTFSGKVGEAGGAADTAGSGLDKLGTQVGGVGVAADTAGSGLDTFGQQITATGTPLERMQVSVVGADRELGTFGQGLSSTGGDLDAFGEGLRSATGSFGQFSAGLGGFGNGLGAAGLGLNSFNTGIGGLIPTIGFTSMSLGNLGKSADLSRIDLAAAVAGSRDAFMRGATYLNDMSKAGLMLTQEFLRWQAELMSRRVIVNESGQFEVAPAFGANAKGDFSAVFALQQRNRERVAAAQQAQVEEQAAKKAAKLKQKELEKQVMEPDSLGSVGGVNYGKPVPSVHITLEGSDTTKYTRDQVIALMDQMGEAIGDGARISVS